MSDKENDPKPNDPREHPDKEKAEVHNEEVKERHTTHWDFDYMTREQIEQAYQEGQEESERHQSQDREQS